MIRCVRIWTGSIGESQFEEGMIELTGGERGDLLSGKTGATTISFQETKSGGTFAWHDAPARQVVGKIAARLGPREALHRNTGGLGLGLSLARRGRQFFELQFELIDQALTAFGARAEQLALHLGDQELQVLDQGLGTRQLGAGLDQRSLQRIVIVGNMISCRCHDAIRS